MRENLRTANAPHGHTHTGPQRTESEEAGRRRTQADAWTQVCSMRGATPSRQRHGHASAAVGGKLYVFGGAGDDYDVERGPQYLSTAAVYDPADDRWAQASSLTSARASVVAVAL